MDKNLQDLIQRLALECRSRISTLFHRLITIGRRGAVADQLNPGIDQTDVSEDLDSLCFTLVEQVRVTTDYDGVFGRVRLNEFDDLGDVIAASFEVRVGLTMLATDGLD